MKRKLLVHILLLGIIYIIVARLGLALNAVSGFATLVWIPSGLSVVALYRFGYRLAPGVFLGALVANMLTGAPLLVALGIATGNMLEAVVGVYLLKWRQVDMGFTHIRDVMYLAFVIMPLSAAVSATIGVSCLLVGQIIPLVALYPTWQAWWIGDMLSILLIPALVLAWWRPLTQPSRSLVETIGLAIATLATGVVAFFGLFPLIGTQITYLAFGPLIWAALRFGSREAVTVATAMAVLAILGAIHSVTFGDLSKSLLPLQVFLGVIIITSLGLSAITAEASRK